MENYIRPLLYAGMAASTLSILAILASYLVAGNPERLLPMPLPFLILLLLVLQLRSYGRGKLKK